MNIKLDKKVNSAFFIIFVIISVAVFVFGNSQSFTLAFTFGMCGFFARGIFEEKIGQKLEFALKKLEH